jgi:hypothetical protein
MRGPFMSPKGETFLRMVGQEMTEEMDNPDIFIDSEPGKLILQDRATFQFYRTLSEAEMAAERMPCGTVHIIALMPAPMDIGPIQAVGYVIAGAGLHCPVCAEVVPEPGIKKP